MVDQVSLEIEDVNSTSKKLKISVPPTEVDAALDSACETVRRKANIKGFRKGKAPVAMVKKIYGAEIESEAMQSLLNDSYLKALDQCDDLRIVSRPTIHDVDFSSGKPFRYEATVEVMPEINVKKYKGLAAEVLDDQITDDQVTSHINQIRESHATLVPLDVDRPSETGDHVIVDSEAMMDGAAFGGGTVQGFTVELGKGGTIPGFDENITGMKPGDLREFDLTFSGERFKDSELDGKTVHFKVTLKEIKKKVLPELNDDFARDLGEFSSFAQFQDNIAKQLREASSERFRREVHGKLIDALVEENELQVPQTLVDHEVEHLLQEAKRNFNMHGRRIDDNDPFYDKLREDFKEQGKKRVQAGFLLDAVGKKEGIEVSESDLERYLQKLAESVQKPLEEVKRFYSTDKAAESLKLKILEEKTLEFLMENAKIKKKMIPSDELSTGEAKR